MTEHERWIQMTGPYRQPGRARPAEALLIGLADKVIAEKDAEIARLRAWLEAPVTILPGAFSETLPAEVPVRLGQDGPVIGQATVTEDADGLHAETTFTGRPGMSFAFREPEPEPELHDPAGQKPPRITWKHD